MIPNASGNPFAALSRIVAPAILTNASSVRATESDPSFVPQGAHGVET